MAQYISHTLPLLKGANPKKNHKTIVILFGDNDHTVIAHLKKRLCFVRVSHCSFRTCSFVSALVLQCNWGNVRNRTNFHSSRANEHWVKNKSMKRPIRVNSLNSFIVTGISFVIFFLTGRQLVAFKCNVWAWYAHKEIFNFIVRNLNNRFLHIPYFLK